MKIKGLGSAERSRGARPAPGSDGSATPGKDKKKITRGAIDEAKSLIWLHRKRLSLGLGLMIVNRLAGLVLPTTSKYLMDNVVLRNQWELLPRLAMAAGAATLVESLTSFSLSQVLGVAAQRAITEMRKDVEAHVMRLPVRYFDSTKTGVLISRIMTDAEGIRNLVGTGLVQLTGSILTAILALCVLIYLNWQLTAVTMVVLASFGGGMAMAFKRLRPLFRERGQINAEVTGRLAESLGGVRIVKAYTAEKREELVFAKGAHRLFRNVAQSLTGVSSVSAFSTLVLGAIGISMMLVGGHAIRQGQMTIGDFVMYLTFTALITVPVVQLANIGTQLTEAFAGLDRIREIRQMATEDQEDANRAALPDLRGDVEFQHVNFEYNAGTLPVNQDQRLTPRNGLSVDETIRRIEECKSWMVLKHVENDPTYRELLYDCLAEVKPLSERIVPGMREAYAYIFLTSPGSVTPYHMDPEHNFLLQIRGSKTVHLFDGRDQFTRDTVTFSAFAHLRMRKDANESDQSVIQYFVDRDPTEPNRTHLYRREARRLMGDSPEKMQELFPAYIFCEDIKTFDVKYWDVKKSEWVDEWRTTKKDMHPDRLPERVKVTLGIMDPNNEREIKYTMQTLLFLQEKLDFSK